ncbi:MAG: hypothetical protein RLZZ156_2085 [Deinococcota bacterium]
MLGLALAVPLQALPNVPYLPDASRIDVVGLDLKVKHATGVVMKRTLTLIADKARLPALAKVNLWVAVPNEDVKNLVGTVSRDGKDIILEIAKEKVSFEEILREVYSIKLEWKAL